MQVFKGFKLKFNRSKGGVIIYYVYVESGYLNKNLKYIRDIKITVSGIE